MKSTTAIAGFAAAMLLGFASAPACAGAAIVCKARTGAVVYIGPDGSQCSANSDGSSTAHASAKGGALAQASVQTGSDAHAIATDQSESFADSDSGGHSRTRAEDSGSVAEALAERRGLAKSFATGGSTSQAEAFGPCYAEATATRSSTAFSVCENGGFVHVEATNGGGAAGYDDKPPSCTPGAGTARVRSSGGDCG